jgi:hypothetical protein
MSALPPIADIIAAQPDVRFVPKADISLTKAGALADAPTAFGQVSLTVTIGAFSRLDAL